MGETMTQKYSFQEWATDFDGLLYFGKDYEEWFDKKYQQEEDDKIKTWTAPCAGDFYSEQTWHIRLD